MTGWVTKSRLYLLSTVIQHGTQDWKLVSDVINTHLSDVIKCELTETSCKEEYMRLVPEESSTPVSSSEPSLHAKLVQELTQLRIEEIDARLSACRLQYLSVHEDRDAIESGGMSEHYVEICREIERKGNGFDLKVYLEENGSRMDVVEKEVKPSSKNRSKSKSSKNAITDKDSKKTDPAMMVTIPTTHLPPAPPCPLPPVPAKRGDISQTPSIDTHSLNIGSPSCTETSRDMESKSEHSFAVHPRNSRSAMAHPIKQCILTRVEKEAGTAGIKTWRKAILLVWREATQHKYANVFLNSVTNEEAPGYRNIVRFPFDLNSIKRNIESGKINTTREFQRDMMLLFLNAIMYNRSDHVVSSMAQEMLFDVVESVESFIDTQLKLYRQKEAGADDESRITVMKTRRARRATLEEESMGIAKRKRVDSFMM